MTYSEREREFTFAKNTGYDKYFNRNQLGIMSQVYWAVCIISRGSGVDEKSNQ